MMPKNFPARRKKQRLVLTLSGLAFLAGAVVMVLTAFEENIVFFFTPSEVAAEMGNWNKKDAQDHETIPQGNFHPKRLFRLGGMVVDGSVVQVSEDVFFEITDGVQKIRVRYRGVLPDLFREGQGVVALGQMEENYIFAAHEVLAKHDENYMPPEAFEAMKRAREQGKKKNGAIK